jgi:predicted membrane channel-forming protein YqfA (hemolysin III family)
MFVAMGLSAIFPVLHGLELYGIEEMRDRIGLTWLVLQGFLYILGAGLYAVRSPESLIRVNLIFSGTLARTIMAWLFRYLGELTSDISCACCHGSCIASVWPVESVRLSPWSAWVDVLDMPHAVEPRQQKEIEIESNFNIWKNSQGSTLLHWTKWISFHVLYHLGQPCIYEAGLGSLVQTSVQPGNRKSWGASTPLVDVAFI